MAEILKTRRVTTKHKYHDLEYRTVKNPLYDAKVHKDHIHGVYGLNQYFIPEYIEKEFPITITTKKSHIEYLIKCSHCSSQGWVRRKDAKYCTSNCRKLAYIERKKQQQTKDEPKK